MTHPHRCSSSAALLCLAAIAAWTAGGRARAEDGAAIYVDESGRVGVGTTSPAAPLDVKGDAVVSGDLAVGSSLSVSGPVKVVASHLSVAGRAAIGDAAFVSGPHGAPDNGLTVQGRVGIGTPSPAAPLDVNGNAVVSGDLAVGNSLSVSGTVKVSVRRQNDDDPQTTTYQRSQPQPYHLSISAQHYNGRTKQIPMSVLQQLCSKSDGCEVHLWTTGWGKDKDAASPEMVTRFFFYAGGSNQGSWKTLDVIGRPASKNWGPGNNAHALIYENKCFFTPITYTGFPPYQPKDQPKDLGTGMLLLLWDGDSDLNHKDTKTPRTCELLLLP